MNIKIEVNLPNFRQDVEEYKKVFGDNKIKAYSLDNEFNIIEGEGYIAPDGNYNYHNNYDNSEDCLWFSKKQQWWTPSEDKIKILQKENIEKAVKTLNQKIDQLNEK